MVPTQQCTLKDHQVHCISEELSLLCDDKLIPWQHSLTGLNSFIDNIGGLMIVGGRFYQSAMDDNFRHPIFLDNNSHITQS